MVGLLPGLPESLPAALHSRLTSKAASSRKRSLVPPFELPCLHPSAPAWCPGSSGSVCPGPWLPPPFTAASALDAVLINH